MTATPSRAGRPSRTSPSRLATRPFLTVLAIAALGFTVESILRTVIPLMVLDRGGDAVWVGVIALGAALPSVLFRPTIGRLIDTWRPDLLLRAGAFIVAAGSLLFLLPGVALLAVTRFIHGTGWAAFSVADHSLMAKLAPARRRGEASGYFMAMPAIATLIGPALGVMLYVGAGEVPPLLLALVLGLVAVGATLMVRFPPRTEPDRAAEARTGGGRIVERSALPATVMITTFMAGHSLFMVFPPVYVAAVGAPVEFLAVYYPLYGLVMTVSQLAIGRVSDRLGRRRSIGFGCGLAIVGFALALVLPGLLALVVASVTYAVAISLVSPTLSALTIDLAPPGRLGAAMATYTLGYQLATGASSIVWGFIISIAGFPWPFVVAIGLQLVTIVLSRRPTGSGTSG